MPTNTTVEYIYQHFQEGKIHFDVFKNLIVEMKLYLSSAWVSPQVPRWRCPTKKLEMLKVQEALIHLSVAAIVLHSAQAAQNNPLQKIFSTNKCTARGNVQKRERES